MSVPSLLFTVAPQLRGGHSNGSNYILIRCPFHGGGQEKTPSCSVSTTKPVFFCHSCQEAGHLTWLLRQLGMGASAAKNAVDDLNLHDKRRSREMRHLVAEWGGDPFRGQFILDDAMIDIYRQAPVRLLEDGFKMSTLRHFEVGYDDRNFRITFPLRNIYGELVGVSGRAILEGQEPRYKIYVEELIKRRQFHVPEHYSMEAIKSALLWHGHVVHPFFYETDDEALLIHEGFKACMWNWQWGYETAVALVGAHLSDLHAEMIALHTKHVTLFLDNNEAGWKGTFFGAEKLLRKGIHVRIARYPDEREQPDDLSEEEVHTAIRNRQSFEEWKADHDGLIAQVAWKRSLRRANRQG